MSKFWIGVVVGVVGLGGLSMLFLAILCYKAWEDS